MKSATSLPTSPYYYSRNRLLKLLSTSIKVDNADAGFNLVEFGNGFAEFIIQLFFQSRHPSSNIVHMNSANGLPSATLISMLKNQCLFNHDAQWSRQLSCRLHFI